jgi:hypothetical protein
VQEFEVPIFGFPHPQQKKMQLENQRIVGRSPERLWHQHFEGEKAERMS